MFKNIYSSMSRYQKIVDKALKIKNFDPLTNNFLNQDYKLFGLEFPSSRMIKEPIKIYEKNNEFKCNSCNTGLKPIKPALCKPVFINDNKLSEIEKIIGLDFPNSRFN